MLLKIYAISDMIKLGLANKILGLNIIKADGLNLYVVSTLYIKDSPFSKNIFQTSLIFFIQLEDRTIYRAK